MANFCGKEKLNNKANVQTDLDNSQTQVDDAFQNISPLKEEASCKAKKCKKIKMWVIVACAVLVVVGVIFAVLTFSNDNDNAEGKNITSDNKESVSDNKDITSINKDTTSVNEDIASANEDVTSINEAVTSSDANIKEYISEFDDLLKFTMYTWYSWEGKGNADFSKLSTEQVLRDYVLDVDSAYAELAAHFSKHVELHAYYTEDDAPFGDPKKEFLNWYAFDADSIDWILINVFGKNPDRSLKESGRYYYKGDKLYSRAPEGGGGEHEYHIVDYRSIGDDKYEIDVKVIPPGDDDPEYYPHLKFVASPRNDAKYGKYWRIYSITKSE